MYNFHYLSEELTLQNGVNASDCVLIVIVIIEREKGDTY